MYYLDLQTGTETLTSPQMAEEFNVRIKGAFKAAEKNKVSAEEIVAFCLAQMISDTHQIASDARRETPSHKNQRSD